MNDEQEHCHSAHNHNICVDENIKTLSEHQKYYI